MSFLSILGSSVRVGIDFAIDGGVKHVIDVGCSGIFELDDDHRDAGPFEHLVMEHSVKYCEFCGDALFVE